MKQTNSLCFGRGVWCPSRSEALVTGGSREHVAACILCVVDDHINMTRGATCELGKSHINVMIGA